MQKRRGQLCRKVSHPERGGHHTEEKGSTLQKSLPSRDTTQKRRGQLYRTIARQKKTVGPSCSEHNLKATSVQNL